MRRLALMIASDFGVSGRLMKRHPAEFDEKRDYIGWPFALVAFVITLFWAVDLAAEPLPIVPNESADLFGMTTTAGSGRHLSTPETTVCKVVNLNDTGTGIDTNDSDKVVSGDLRYCLTGYRSPRTVVFEVAGNIELTSNYITITDSYVTVAGQTAPSPGITILNGGIKIERTASDILIEHLRIRPGETHAHIRAASGWVSESGTVFSYAVPSDHNVDESYSDRYGNSVEYNYVPLTKNNGAGANVGLNEYDFDKVSDTLYVNVGENPENGLLTYNREKSEWPEAINLVGKSPYPHNIILKNISATHSADMNMITGGYNVTIMDSLFADGVGSPIFLKGPHSKNLFITCYEPDLCGDNTAVVRNLIIGSPDRNPETSGGSVYAANNYVYDTWQSFEIFDDQDRRNSDIKYSLIGNYIVETDKTKYSPYMVAGVNTTDQSADSRVYIGPDNFWSGTIQTDPWNSESTTAFHMRSALCCSGTDIPLDNRAATAADAIDVPGYDIMTAVDARDYVLTNAGAYPVFRDSVDQSIIDRATTASPTKTDMPQTAMLGNEFCVANATPFNCCTGIGTGSCPDVDWPTVVGKSRAFVLPEQFNNLTASGYTQLEIWLHGFSLAVEGSEMSRPTNLRFQ